MGRLARRGGLDPVGEPTPSMCVDGHCDWRTNTCPADAAAVLRGFFDATGARIRELDPGRSSGDGRVGGESVQLGRRRLPQCVDVRRHRRNRYHDYEQGGSLPGHETGDLGQRLVGGARGRQKPLVVAEIRIPAGAAAAWTTGRPAWPRSSAGSAAPEPPARCCAFVPGAAGARLHAGHRAVRSGAETPRQLAGSTMPPQTRRTRARPSGLSSRRAPGVSPAPNSR